MKAKLTTRALCEGAIMVTLAQLLSWLKFYELPQGGSVTISMLPIFLFAVRWGLGKGILASVAFSLMQLIFDGAFAWSWQSIIGDYLAAFTVLGIAGVFKGTKYGVYYGTLLGSAARFVCHYITGATVWAEYMPESFFGVTMTTPWFYSALYNGFYMAINAALCILIFALLYRPLKKYIQEFVGAREKA